VNQCRDRRPFLPLITRHRAKDPEQLGLTTNYKEDVMLRNAGRVDLFGIRRIPPHFPELGMCWTLNNVVFCRVAFGLYREV